MGRLSFKKKSKTSSPTALSPGDPAGSPSSVPEKGSDKHSLGTNPNESSSPVDTEGAVLTKSFSSPAKSARSSSSIGRVPGNNNSDPGMFSEQLQRLRARLQSVVQGVREVAQSLDEPHTLISNVRDQLQTRQEVAAARRNAMSLASSAAERDVGVGGATVGSNGGGSGPSSVGLTPAPPPTLARTSGGGKSGGSFRRNNTTSAAIAAGVTAFAPLATAHAGPHEVTLAASPDGAVSISDGGAIDGANRSVKARVAEVERRSRSGGGVSEPLPVLSGPTLVVVSSVTAEGSLVRNPVTQPSLVAVKSFGSGRRSGSAAVATEPTSAESPTNKFLVPESPKLTPPGSRPNSGTWRPVIIPPVAPGPPAAVAGSLNDAKSHPQVADRSVSRRASTSGVVDIFAALAAPDLIAAGAAELLGSGDDSLLAATANPAAAEAYLREHPETLRELWTLRARVRAQESELASMVMQLSTKNAQLDQVQISLQTKEKDFSIMTQNLTGVLTKLQSFQAVQDHEGHLQDQLRRAHAGGESESANAGNDNVHSTSRTCGIALTATPRTAATSPEGVVHANDATAAVEHTSSSALLASSTPQTPLRIAPVASSSAAPTAGASHFATAKAALQAEAEAAAAATATAGSSRAPRNTASVGASSAASTPATAAASPATSAAASVGSSPENKQGGPWNILEVSLPPPPSARAAVGSASQVEMEEDKMEVATKEAALSTVAKHDGGNSSCAIETATHAVSWPSLPSSVAAEAAAPLSLSQQPVADAGSAAITAPDGSEIVMPSPQNGNLLPETIVEPVRAEDTTSPHAAQVAATLRELSAIRERAEMQNGQLASMRDQLSVKDAQLNEAQITLVSKDRQLSEAAQRLDNLMAQLRNVQEAPQPLLLQAQRPRRQGGLLRVLLLQLAPSLACVGLLLRDVASTKEMRELRRFKVDPQSPEAKGLRLLSSQQSLLPHQERGLLSSPRQQALPPSAVQPDVDRRSAAGEALQQRVVKAATAAVAAARVRPAGVRRVRLVSMTPVPPSPPASPAAVPDASEQRTPWSSECKSHWCKIIRPPPQKAMYY